MGPALAFEDRRLVGFPVGLLSLFPRVTLLEKGNERILTVQTRQTTAILVLGATCVTQPRTQGRCLPLGLRPEPDNVLIAQNNLDTLRHGSTPNVTHHQYACVTIVRI